MELAGTLVRITEDDLGVVSGTVVVEDGRIQGVREEPVDSSDVVLPAFVNAHTHIGDSIAKEAGRDLSLDELVAPPDGLKHRLLREASREEKRRAMRRTVEQMRRIGTGTFVDFREGGVEGVRDLRRAVEGTGVDAVVLGRGPVEVLGEADGYGASGARDGDFWGQREAAREKDKPFGIHAGERDIEDIDGARALEPDFLVHMVHARQKDLEWLERTGTPVAVCPRSNRVTGVGLPPVEDLVEHTSVALGTDNVMLNSVSMWREMEWVSKHFDIGDEEVLRMATVNGAQIAGLEDVGVLREGVRARLQVLHGDRELAGVRDVVAGVVRRAGAGDVKRVVLE